MSNYILCQEKKAKLPFYIENISINIYTMEELCFYCYNNIYLLDETILNEELCRWIREELGQKKLAQKLTGLLDNKSRMMEFILLIIKENNYLSQDDYNKFSQKLQKLAMEPDVLRQKLKGDYLMEHGKIVNAIKVYQNALKVRLEEIPETHDRLGSQFVGAIYHNMGCAYARLFQMEEAVWCFEQAYGSLHTMFSMKSYLYAVYMEWGVEKFEEKCLELGLEETKIDEMLLEIEAAVSEMLNTKDGQMYARAKQWKEQGEMDKYHEMMDQMLHDFTKEYHRGTGY